LEAVVPVSDNGSLLDSQAAANRGLGGLHGWLSKAEGTFNQHTKSNRSLSEQLNYINQLSAQFPIAPLRVIYAASGTQPAACLLRDERGVVEHMLYWMTPASEPEARYLIAILNSETGRARAEQYQARGQWGARHFDKVMFNLPIPRFDAGERLHLDLAAAASRAEEVAASVELPEGVKFQRARGLIRAALAETGIAQTIDGLVARLLDRV
jgi:hypothetical protein